MTPATLNTILNSVPVILQGANKLIKMIRDRKRSEEPELQEELPVTIEGLKQGLERMEQRVDANLESHIEQIKLIEELARQNKAMAESIQKGYQRLTQVTVIAVAALLLAGAALLFAVLR